ncbi:hypothetical protein DEU56DRAFT_5028 [Suillus clintonianus]|uniref:uncharacterized protein n=1 Tax=Suillus clintonianus TaxID=1904413 RepID=UPI001B87C05E|nr:uncharacterized protein DEU56DRAFT_5028 [Suillus clintonianus]KAG2157118.1 hypothetical protein DEU56DRAFT_5028 [Suillus clintonianus]
MAQTRCRFFDENGNPLDGGCYRGGQCNFVHPDSPAWETAQVRSFTRGRGMGRGGSFGESRGSFARGRGRGSAPVNTYNSSSALGWDTGGGSDSNAQSSGWVMTSSKDPVKPASGDMSSLWGTDDAWGLDSGAKGSASTGGWGDTDSWGGNSGTKDSSAGGGDGWGNPSNSDKGTTDMTSHVQAKRSVQETKESSAVGWDRDSFEWGKPSGSDRAQEKPSSPGAKESSAGGWGSSNTWDTDVGTKGTSGGGWGNPPGGDKSPDGYGASVTMEMTSIAQPKRNDADQENYRSKPPTVPPPPRPLRRGSRAQYDEEDTRPLKMTGTNDVPMTNTRWGKKLDMTAPSPAESSERPRVPPLQSSALNNSMAIEQPAPLSASRSEDGRIDVETWQRNTVTLPENTRGGSPSLSTVTGSTVNRKRKHGGSDLEKQQETWRDFIRLCDRAVRAKVDLAKAEVERQNWRRAQKSAIYSRIGEAGRIRLDGHRIELEKICVGHSDKLSQAIRELAEIGDKLKSGIDYDRRYDVGDEVTGYLNEVGAWLSDIRPLLIANTRQHPPTNQPTPHEDEPPEVTPVIPNGLDTVRSRLDKQEERLEELRTTLTLESSMRPMATINDRIDKKMKILRDARAEARAQQAKLPPPKVDLPPEATGAIEDVSRKATELSAALDAPIHDIAQLLVRQDEIQKTQDSHTTENEELKESIAKLKETSAANRKLIQEQTEAIQRLEASFEAVSKSRRTPPPAEPPIKVMYDDLRGAVDVVVQGIISRDVIPKMKKLTDHCRTENQRIHGELFEVIWDAIEPGLKISEAVNRWVAGLELPAS